jgi:hypothetical protein
MLTNCLSSSAIEIIPTVRPLESYVRTKLIWQALVGTPRMIGTRTQGGRWPIRAAATAPHLAKNKGKSSKSFQITESPGIAGIRGGQLIIVIIEKTLFVPLLLVYNRQNHS